MSCDCEHKRMGADYERMRRLAKALARMEDETVAMYRNPDGTYGFGLAGRESEKTITEYISPY